MPVRRSMGREFTVESSKLKVWGGRKKDLTQRTLRSRGKMRLFSLERNRTRGCGCGRILRERRRGGRRLRRGEGLRGRVRHRRRGRLGKGGWGGRDGGCGVRVLFLVGGRII